MGNRGRFLVSRWIILAWVVMGMPGCISPEKDGVLEPPARERNFSPADQVWQPDLFSVRYIMTRSRVLGEKTSTEQFLKVVDEREIGGIAAEVLGHTLHECSEAGWLPVIYSFDGVHNLYHLYPRLDVRINLSIPSGVSNVTDLDQVLLAIGITIAAPAIPTPSTYPIFGPWRLGASMPEAVLASSYRQEFRRRLETTLKRQFRDALIRPLVCTPEKLKGGL